MDDVNTTRLILASKQACVGNACGKLIDGRKHRLRGNRKNSALLQWQAYLENVHRAVYSRADQLIFILGNDSSVW